ncbi:lipase family alpha/beta hydrolase [Knoellia sp. CPCC 206435]|uniref:lipase family alpha/beta hydrolase n=1 Tax=Knoellia terrae TaxID=3404797 RepID=UPI003B435F80
MSQGPSDETDPDDAGSGPVEPTVVEQRLMRGVEHVAGVSDHLVHHPAPNSARAFVNAFFGDRLDLSGSPLAHTMGVRRRGRSVPLTAEGFAAAFPGATGAVVVLVHGLVVHETAWQRGRFGHRLEEDLGFTSVAVRYNTGLRISTNGHELDRVLTALVAHWPVPVTRLVLLGHSMGGLVIHSALAQADVEADWIPLVSDTVTLGSPHLGAPLERFANGSARVAGRLRHSRPLATLLRARSVGIQDLRHGNILDEEWDGLALDDRTGRRLDVPLHPGVRHLAIVGLLGRRIDGPVAQLLGDGMVPASSARGSGRRAPGSRRFAEEDVVVLPGVGHLALVHEPIVYDAIRDRLSRDPGDVEAGQEGPGRSG